MYDVHCTYVPRSTLARDVACATYEVMSAGACGNAAVRVRNSRPGHFYLAA